jgi:hypothetical protein
MKLPPTDNLPGEWPVTVATAWHNLLAKVSSSRDKVGNSDAFEQARTSLTRMAGEGRFDGLNSLLARRVGARALTWLWLHDKSVGPRLLSERMINVLVEQQKPRLSRLTLLQLIQLYFRRFDLLDKAGSDTQLRAVVQAHILRQLQLVAEKGSSLVHDLVHSLNHQGSWLLALEGPEALARQVREEGTELDIKFKELGLLGFDTGRYGDICRAHYYLEVLRQLKPGETDPVFAELSKPAVSKAPYGEGRRIGHAALEILIDRGGDEPGDAWLSFILGLAGDPRLGGGAPSFREWWLPLGEQRIAKVRGWLIKEDLRIFLRAVEQYGFETENRELQRMFPARKLFLEGLHDLDLIRDARLMLGRSAQSVVKRILGGEIQTVFASMDGIMNDKAVIYLDCGSFHVVEGSHSFKVWLYLAQPGPDIKFGERKMFTHNELTVSLPKSYKAAHPGLPHKAITHNGHWQHKVFEFLNQNGISLDIEQLLSKSDYRMYLMRYGLPVVGLANRSSVAAPLRPIETVPATAIKSTISLGTVPVAQIAEPKAVVASTKPLKPLENTRVEATSKVELSRANLPSILKGLHEDELQVLQYFIDNPGDKVRHAANILDIEARDINRMLYGALSAWLEQVDGFGWKPRPQLIHKLERMNAP